MENLIGDDMARLPALLPAAPDCRSIFTARARRAPGRKMGHVNRSITTWPSPCGWPRASQSRTRMPPIEWVTTWVRPAKGAARAAATRSTSASGAARVDG
jgi:hypothetical protein